MQSRKKPQSLLGCSRYYTIIKPKPVIPSSSSFPKVSGNILVLDPKWKAVVFALSFLELLPIRTVVSDCRLSWEQNYFSLAGPPISVVVKREGGNLHLSLQKEKLFPMTLLLKYSFASFINLRKFFISKKGISKPQTHLRSCRLPILAIFIISFVIFEAFSSKY